MTHLITTKSGKTYLTDDALAVRPRDDQAAARMKYQCKTCGREYRSFMAFTFEHGDCACPCMVTWKEA